MKLFYIFVSLLFLVAAFKLSLAQQKVDSFLYIDKKSISNAKSMMETDSAINADQKSSNYSEGLLEKIAIGLLISLVTSFVTVRLSMNKFREENRWQLKSKAYIGILESLHHLKKYCAEMEAAELDEIHMSPDRQKQLNTKWRESLDLIELETDKGSFIISNEATKILVSFQKERRVYEDNPNWIEYLDTQWKAIDKCMQAIRECAKNDLHI